MKIHPQTTARKREKLSCDVKRHLTFLDAECKHTTVMLSNSVKKHFGLNKCTKRNF